MPNEYDVEIKNIEEFKAEQQEHVNNLNALNRLAKNRDFRRVIDKGLFETKAIELVLQKADPSSQSEQDQKNIIIGIDAIGFLRQHFSSITSLGRAAEQRLIEADVTLDELRGERDAEEAESLTLEDE